MEAITTIIVCVEFADFLSVTLPWNREVLDRVLVVTDPEDEQTLDVASQNDVSVLTTKVFFEREAQFNKWSAVNQGVEYLGVRGWCLILDADLMLPQSRRIGGLKRGFLHQARRVQVPAWRTKIEPEKNWKRYKRMREFAGGYFHLFHTEDPEVRSSPYLDCWRWCATGDAEFESRWPESRKVLLPFDVVHLGTPQVNWCGRSEPFRDGSLPERSAERRDAVAAMRRQVRVNAGLDDRYQGHRL